MGKKMEHCKKKTTITIRCSEESKKRLMGKAKKSGKSLSSYLLDTGVAGLESRQGRRKRMVKALVELTEPVNAVYDSLQAGNPGNGDLKGKLDKIVEGVGRLWEI